MSKPCNPFDRINRGRPKISMQEYHEREMARAKESIRKGSGSKRLDDLFNALRKEKGG